MVSVSAPMSTIMPSWNPWVGWGAHTGFPSSMVHLSPQQPSRLWKVPQRRESGGQFVFDLSKRLHCNIYDNNNTNILEFTGLFQCHIWLYRSAFASKHHCCLIYHTIPISHHSQPTGLHADLASYQVTQLLCEPGSQMAERLGNPAIIQKVAGSILGHAK